MSDRSRRYFPDPMEPALYPRLHPISGCMQIMYGLAPDSTLNTCFTCFINAFDWQSDVVARCYAVTMVDSLSELGSWRNLCVDWIHVWLGAIKAIVYVRNAVEQNMQNSRTWFWSSLRCFILHWQESYCVYLKLVLKHVGWLILSVFLWSTNQLTRVWDW